MATTGIVIQFPDENVVHPTVKDKDNNPMTVKDIRTRDHQRVQNLQERGYNVEIIWGKDWQALLTQRPEIKVFLAQHRTFTHFKKYLAKIKSFNIFVRDVYLALLNVTLKYQSN